MLTAGNIRSHGVIGGEPHVVGCVGECPVACNLGVIVAAEGVGDYRREHTIGGIASASGCRGRNPGVGPIGGPVHASDEYWDPADCHNYESTDTLCTDLESTEWYA